jgi:dTDP-4-amino-4,6-dideoxygalactose transaminase
MPALLWRLNMSERREVPFGRPVITDDDRRSVLEVLEGHILTHGPQCKAFEAEFSAFLGPTAHSVSVSSCMAALHLSCLHFGFRPGDEVLVAAQTHVATAHAVEWTGATPVFIDCDPQSGNVTAEIVERAITPRTKALLLVHFVGIPCNMPAIMEVAARHRIKVIEDCAIALGARYDGTHVGLFGDAACFSFYPVKHLTSAEGGMFVSRHKDVVDHVTRVRAFGVDRTYAERTLPGLYDVPMLGLNYRMSELQAALGRSQLRRLAETLRIRAANFASLKGALQDVDGLGVIDATDPKARNSHYCLTIQPGGRWQGRRNDFVRAVNAAGVGTSVHYPQPVPRMAYYQTKYGYDPAAFAGAEAISDGTVALPVAPHLAAGDVDYIARVVTRVARGEA